VEGRALVGRDRELDAFAAALRAVNAGERPVLMLNGEPGIGKTRMLEELAARVLAQGGVAAWGRMWEVAMTPAFWPFIQVLSALETADDPAPLLGTLEQRADASLRLARFGEVVRFLARRAAQAPLAILLDDLHAADPSSLQLLEYALPLLVGQRVLFALAARDSDASPEVSAALSRIQRMAQRLPLARLDRAQVAAMVGAQTDSARVFELSEGNPLFVAELVASAHAVGALRLPALSSVRDVIRSRVRALPQATLAALHAASVVGRDFRGQVVAHMLGADDAAQRLAPVLSLAMVAMTGPDRYRFSHALVAEAIADELEPAERARLHLRAAQAIERHAPDDSGAIAHHLLAAGPLSAEAAVRAAERAAQRCSAQLAFEDAAGLLERALGALALAAPADRRRRALLLCARAEALQHATRPSSAAELCDEAAGLVRALDATAGDSAHSDDSAQLLARIALVRGLEFRFGRTDPLLVSMLQEALDKLRDHGSPLRAKLLARLAAAEQPARDPREPLARALEAIELAANLEPRDRMDVMYVASAALVDYLDPEQLERIQLELLSLARSYDRAIYVHTRLRLCFSALDRVDRPAFDAAVEVFTAEAAALGLPRWTRQVHMLKAMSALLEGRFADAAAEAQQCEAISAALGDPSAAWMMDVHYAMSASVRTAPIDPPLAERLALYTPGGVAIPAWIAANSRSLEATRAALARFDGAVPPHPDLAALLASAVVFADDARLAALFYDALAARSGRIVLAAMVGSVVLDLYDRLLLALAATARRWDVIERHAERALSIAARIGSPLWIAHSRATLAEALQRRGAPGDARRASKLWAQALSDAERLGMPGLAARCHAAISGAREPEPARSLAPAASRQPIELVRRGELWSVRGFGEQVHVKDSRGIELLARLLAEQGRELHVLDLAGASGPEVSGDAGPMLDHQARATYRARRSELAAERDAAENAGDLASLERIEREIEALSREIERAFGLGGRARRAGAASERARSNIQRRIAHAIDQIRAASPRLGEHLAASVHTGTYCVYAPVT
jgi:hypothetical protein